MRRACLVVLACLASCGARAPAPVDVDALLRARGPVEARRDLVIRVAGDPRDVAAHLALAALDERIARPSEAIDELEAVIALGGLGGARWSAEDQARLARLIAARGRARLARGAATALADLQRARTLGAPIADAELRAALIAGAIVALLHSDAEVRAVGRRTLAAEAVAPAGSAAAEAATPALAAVSPGATVPGGAPGGAAVAASGTAAGASTSVVVSQPATGPGGASGPGAAAPASVAPGTAAGVTAAGALAEDAGQGDAPDATAWLGARPGASVEQRGRFGAWLWRRGARRAAWDDLSAWRAAAPPPRDRALEDAYLAAARWWTPLDLPGPSAALGEEPGAALRCAFAPCAPREVAGDDARERAYLLAALAPPVRDPADAAAVVVIALHQALRGEAAWGAAIAARIDLAAFAQPAALAALPAFVQPVVARLAGSAAAAPPGDGATADQRLVIAAERVLAGAGPAEIAGLADGSPYGDALRAVAAPRAPFAGDARAEAAARHASRVVDGAARLDALRAIVAGYARDPGIADRLARDAVAGASDAAAMHATLGALFDAIGDPARARAAWQAAVDASPEPRFLRGLAGAQARQGDADAALITATSAAAASGDPAVVWVAVAQSLIGAGRDVHGLDAARSAIDLAGPETAAAALDAAIAASRALGRDAQATALAARRARIAPDGGTLGDRDPTDPVAALEAYRAGRGQPGDAAIARLWLASRWNPRDVELRAALLAALAAGDPRRAAIAGELVDLAGDRDPEVGRAAAAALR